jgi:hypothetical protein
MAQLERYLVEGHANRDAVVLHVAEYERLLAQVEELEAIRAYDTAKAAAETAIPLEDALRDIERRKA